MPTREQVLQLVRAGMDYDEIGRRLDVRPGLAYMIATGFPADGGDVPPPEERDRPGWLATSQQLANPQPAENPTRNESVHRWMKQRAQGSREG